MSMGEQSARTTGAGIRPWVPFFFALAPINLILSVDRNAFVMVAPVIQREFGFGLAQMSYILAAISWTYALFQLPSGWLIQRYGFRRLLAIALFGWSLAIGLMPLAAGFWTMLLLRLLLGAAQAPDWPSSVAAIARWFPAERRSRFTSIALSGQYLGPVVGSILTGALAYRDGWRVCFYASALIGVGLQKAKEGGQVKAVPYAQALAASQQQAGGKPQQPAAAGADAKQGDTQQPAQDQAK